MTIDYSAYEQPVTDKDIDALSQASQSGELIGLPLGGLRTARAKLITGLAIGVAVIAFIAFALMAFAREASAGWAMAVAAIGLGAAAVAASYRGQLKIARRWARLLNFAKTNDLDFLVNRQPPYHGLIFDIGEGRVITEAFVFPDGTEIGQYQYEISRGRRGTTTFYWGYARLKLPRRLPHMVLDARLNNLFRGSISNLPKSFDGAQVLRLEGDFNDHFTLYAPKEYEQDAYYLFTPDVMASIIDTGTPYEIEIIDDELFIYAQHQQTLYRKEPLQKMMQVITSFGAELRHQGDYYADHRVENRNLNIIAPSGQRLKQGAPRWLILLMVALLIFILGMQMGAN